MTKYRLLAGTAIVAGTVMAGSQAMAFDEVDWSWDLDVDTDINQRVDIDVDLFPTGLTVLENMQFQIGDVEAESIVSGIDNNQPTGGTNGGPVQIDLVLDVSDETDIDGDGEDGGALVNSASGVDPLDVDASFTDQPGDVNTVDVSFEVDVPASDGVEFDATVELPEVVSTAAAIGNNSNVTSEVKTDIHEGQYLFGEGDIELGTGEGIAAAAQALFFAHLEHQGINTGLSTALAMTAGALYGLTAPAEITATSDVSDILNASVDSSATAVGNNKGITVDAATGGDAILVADVNQFSHANVSAFSSVMDVSVNDYTNLGVITVPGAEGYRPLVDSTATAIGNNLSVTVNSPLND